MNGHRIVIGRTQVYRRRMIRPQAAYVNVVQRMAEHPLAMINFVFEWRKTQILDVSLYDLSSPATLLSISLPLQPLS